MGKFRLAPFVLLVCIGDLTACGHKAQDETGLAANTMDADANATMREAVNDTDAAADKAFGSAEATMDNGAAAIDNAAGATADTTGNALEDAGNEIKE